MVCVFVSMPDVTVQVLQMSITFAPEELSQLWNVSRNKTARRTE